MCVSYCKSAELQQHVLAEGLCCCLKKAYVRFCLVNGLCRNSLKSNPVLLGVLLVVL